MNLLIAAPIREVSESVRFLPAVSIIMPFRPVTTLKKNLEYQIKSAVSNVEAMLIAQYTMDQAIPVITRLKNLVAALNYNTQKKSIAIFISPVVEKVFYFEMEIEEKIVIDPSFKLSDLIAFKRENKECLVLQLNENSSKTFLCSSNHSQVIKSNVFNKLNDASRNEVSGFDSFQERNESALLRFLFQMDQGLSLLLKAYRLPVFVIGPINLVRHFISITQNDSTVTEYIPGRVAEHSTQEVLDVTENIFTNWNTLRQKHLLKKIQHAKSQNKLTTGMKETLRSSVRNRSILLVVEKNLLSHLLSPIANRSFMKSDLGSNEVFFYER